MHGCRANRSAEDLEQLEQRSAAQRPQPQRPAGGVGGLPLAGAELHAAILQRRTQLRPVLPEQQQQPQHQHQSSVGDGGPGAADGSSLEAVLRKGLERFHFGSDNSSSADTHGNTDFIEAAMARGGQQQQQHGS